MAVALRCLLGISQPLTILHPGMQAIITYKATPTADGQAVGVAFDEGENEDSVLALIGTRGDALDVELLHDDKQDGNGDGHQHTACAE